MRENQLKQDELKYIEVQYDPVTQGYLREWCADNGFDLSIKFNGTRQNPDDFDFHSTVWFTTSKHQLENGTLECDVDVTPTGFSLFGDNENILVLNVESDGLQDIRDYYGAEYDMEDEWPDYNPHITVCYNYKGDLPTIDLPNMDLVADKLNIRTQK